MSTTAGTQVVPGLPGLLTTGRVDDLVYSQAWWTLEGVRTMECQSYIMTRPDQPGFWVVLDWHSNFSKSGQVLGPFDTLEEAATTYRLVAEG